jgi:hypothetical protein
MLSPLPRRSGWAYYFAHSPSRISLPRKSGRVGLRIVLFEVCSAFTRVTACTLALSPIRDTLIEGFSHFVTSMTAPIASGWSGCRVGLAPTGKRRLITAHTQLGHRGMSVRQQRTFDTDHKETAISSSAIAAPPTGNAMYCLPPAMYVTGAPAALAGSAVSASILPFALS